ncbi:sodium:alanine symporter family protein [Boudabousia tangfeifanii]|uniref:Sodium:alanine symporter family protein n=1 Tax=Boudabousia tangfeifanii TaxID=1912795 RepID=A0A1D9MJB1_9ACTO|nr:alanine/glycine:cation symporter family protein [Boudabousia tangfeifanii]AOZ72384.1 sodium:alanine symporter family protein [Boudabousia tangfeifanii]
MRPVAFEDTVKLVNDYLYGYILLYLLVGVGLVLTVYLGAPQIRHLGAIFKSLSGSRKKSKDQISSFQAFAVGVGTRVGIGNIGGVALALLLGGPGAIFWMWLIALIGMATAFSESSLAQLFKIRHRDGTFRGGPAYYMTIGLGNKTMALIFAAITVLASGVAVPMVQVNAIASVMQENHGIDPWVTALIMMFLLAPVILGGVKKVAQVAEALVPIMALLYLGLAIVVIVVNFSAAGAALGMIFKGAFGWQAGFGGGSGAFFAALLNGARRGLFSNEAGLGTAPNAAGTATTAHPVQQGLVQALGVFVDTILVCTATALLILIALPEKLVGGTADMAGSLTSNALIYVFGSWITPLVTFIIFIFVYTSSFGAYSYGQVALDYIFGDEATSMLYRTFVVIACGWAAMQSLTLVWGISDVLLGLGAIFNLYALIRLAPWTKAILKDWKSQKGSELHFQAKGNPLLPGDVPTDSWD